MITATKKGGKHAITFTLILSASLLPTPASAGGVSSIVADLYGGDGITLDPTNLFHSPHFQADSQAALNNLSEVIATDANIVALPSASASYTFNIEEGIPVRTTDSFGPILTERPQTIGEGNINVGFFFSRTVFEKFDGEDLNDLTLTLNHIDINPDTPGDPAFERDVINLNLNLELEQNTFAFFGTYGINSFWDVGALVPLVYVDAKVKSVGTIVDNGGDGIHVADPSEPLTDSNDDSAFGLGDIVLRSKANLSNFILQSNGSERSWTPSFGVLGQATLETGDQDDLLGQGETTFLGMLIGAVQVGDASPHVNLGYEVATSNMDQYNNLRYAVGLDGKVTDQFTAALDVIGRWYPDADNNSRDIIDLAIGTKWDPFMTDSPLSLNFLVPINENTGLRPDYTWSVGIDVTF